ncbi:MAG: 50S ribosomal protein L9 [Candidatus Omnitrophota bacterium]|nr:MAG: 50S ribosomal protein L9 [Candidatus Omnitrophota bacterium]
MKIILLKNRERLGKQGDIVEVKGGFARNHLIPQGYALPATGENFKRLEEIKRKKEKSSEREKKSALEFKEKLEGLSLTIPCEVKGSAFLKVQPDDHTPLEAKTTPSKDEDEIYGSVGEPQVLKALRDEGVNLEKGRVIFDDPIKKLGVYSLKIRLHPEVEATLRVWVVKK